MRGIVPVAVLLVALSPSGSAYSEQHRDCTYGDQGYCVLVEIADIVFDCEMAPDGAYLCHYSASATTTGSAPSPLPGETAMDLYSQIYTCAGDVCTWDQHGARYTCTWADEGSCSVGSSVAFDAAGVVPEGECLEAFALIEVGGSARPDPASPIPAADESVSFPLVSLDLCRP